MSALRTIALLTVLAATLAPSAVAQRVFWNLESQTLGMGKVNPLTLVFDECSPSGAVELPVVDDLDFGTPSISTQTSMVNFRTSRRTIYTYPAQPRRRGSFTIPTFSVETDKGPLVVSGTGFEVADASVGRTGLAIGDVVESQLRPARTTVWVGEVVELEYLLVASGRYQASISTEPEWRSPGILVEAFGQPERTEVVVRGERRPALRYRTRFIASAPGRFTLEPVRQGVSVQTGERSTFFFSQPRLEEFSIASDQPEVEVKALPTPAPAGFSGAIGSFELESTVVPEEARVGEPITWTLAMKGTGNWTSGLHLPQREVATDFEVVQPKSREQIDEGRMFTGSVTEDAVLVPTRPGDYRLGPVAFSFFDTTQGRYVDASVPARTVRILPAAATRPGAAPLAQQTPERDPLVTTPTDPETATRLELPADFLAVSDVPRDPVLDSVSGRAPFSLSPLWWLFVAFVPPAFAWIAYAWREAHKGDPTPARKRARRELAAALEAVAARGATPDREFLAQWRSLCIALWRIPHAAPDSGTIARAVETLGGSSTPSVWAELWLESEDALFRPGATVDGAWITRALHAARSARIRRERTMLPLRLRHWAPLALALVVVEIVSAPSATAAARTEDPVLAYREGRYEHARSLWHAQMVRTPRDASIRTNLGITHAQLENWPQAAAHWTSAFLLAPRAETSRAHLLLALSHLDGVDPALRRMTTPSLPTRVATIASPGTWQRIFLSGAAAAALGLVLVLSNLYGRGPRRLRRTGVACVAVGIAASVVAMYSEHRYGDLARPTAALVVEPTLLRSIPTELAENQQTAPLPGGTVVVVEHSMLGWDRVVVSGGAKGWIRREVAVPFYRAPRPPIEVVGEKTSV
ncbi:hypothetical protein ASA1KI_25570 [Opitutales bacterium ASA1]|uniref:BatD family protein n=1 Tax=Congregicoccus parvus TaxID=3081749 RepID=UPI002B319198|nr:hypothetical protein ASA1KI_25570 [Opitutales bacterium ASA1]